MTIAIRSQTGVETPWLKHWMRLLPGGQAKPLPMADYRFRILSAR